VGFEDGARVRSGRGHGQVYSEEIRCGEWAGVIVGPLVMRRRPGRASAVRFRRVSAEFRVPRACVTRVVNSE
jgi:hypothetical protein